MHHRRPSAHRRRAALGYIATLLCLSTPTTGSERWDTQSADPVLASEAVVVMSDRVSWVDVTLTNTTSQPVLAWCAGVTVQDPGGAELEVLVNCRDGYLQWEGFPYVLEQPTVVSARDRVRTRIVVAGLTNQAQARVTVRCAVFLDGSWTGDARYADQIFDERQRSYEGWAAVAGALEAGRSAGRGRDAVVAAIQAIEKTASEQVAALPPGEDPRRALNLVMEGERLNLRQFLVAPKPGAPYDIVSHRLTEARRRLDATKKHLRQPQ